MYDASKLIVEVLLHMHTVANEAVLVLGHVMMNLMLNGLKIEQSRNKNQKENL